MPNISNSAATTFNSYIIAQIIAELNRIGILDLLRDNLKRIDTIADEAGVDAQKLYEVLLHLEFLGVTSIQQGKLVGLTPFGLELKKNIGFFVWAVKGYGNFFSEIGRWIMPNSPVDWASARDGIGVSIGSYLCNKEFMDKFFWEEFDKIEKKCVIDIGCGKGDKIFRINERNNEIDCIGIDVDTPSIEFANKKVESLNLQRSIKFINKNIFEIDFSISEPTVVLCSLMLHDILNKVDPEDFSSWIKKRFPNVEYLIIIDTMMPDGNVKENNDIFFNGFSLVHSFMNVKLLSIEDYKSIFNRNGLSLSKHIKIDGVPNTHLFTIKCND